jgi:hypothetical protein
MHEAGLHIVCLDAPAPPDYGGAIDLFYKVKALAESGRRITLHYFAYKEGRDASGLEPYCDAVYAYPRKGFFSSLWSKQPYITASRNNADLIKKLSEDNNPILLEGVHCAGLVPYFYGKRKLVLRMHNDEAAYYSALARIETNWRRRLYFGLESRLLHHFQKRLPKDIPLACVSHTDIAQLKKNYGFNNLAFIPSFTPWQEVSGKPGRGQYCLYQGNMEVSENREAVSWLIQYVFEYLPLPLVVAGKNIPEYLKADAVHAQVSFVSNPEQEQMDQLVREAQVNILPSFNTTGLKLKLLHALYEGRHCLTNAAGIAGTGFDSIVSIAETPEEFRALTQILWEREFSEEDRDQRTKVTRDYSNSRNAALLNAWL